MNLIIDIGNTLTKVAVFSGQEICFNKIYESLTLHEVKVLVNKFNIVHSIISEVKTVEEELENYLKTTTHFIQLDHQTPLPFTNLYTTPATLGKDRLALAAAASKLYPHMNVLVIDAGTCITYDMVNEENEYIGGGISPGLALRLRSLAEFTGKLPRVKITDHEMIPLVGNSTESAIKSGVVNGIKHEIEGAIHQFSEQYNDLKIVLTGGNIERFEIASKNRIFADPFLVLKGLNEILKINAKN